MFLVLIYVKLDQIWLQSMSYRNIIFIFFVVFIINTNFLFAQDTFFKARIVSVYDGDTMHIRFGNNQELVRLYGVDCPEIGQPFAEQAKNRVHELVLGQLVELDVKTVDRYGRKIVEIVIDDGNANLNHLLVKEGLCWWFEDYARKDLLLSDFQVLAQIERRGLWIDDNPLPPWDYRSGNYKNASTHFAVKKTRSNICHASGSRFYDTVKVFTLYDSVDECLKSGGRLPK